MSKKLTTVRQYNTELLKALHEKTREETYKGVKIKIKPIPEGGNSGDMDPRIYKGMKNAALMVKLMNMLPKSKKPKTPLETILPLRKMFGTYKGAYIANEGIKTDYINVKSADGYDVPVRVYAREKHGEGLPTLVYYHGGGFFGGGVDIVEQMCKLLVQKKDMVVFNIDYRLCPENSYPKPPDDCFYATVWASENAQLYGGKSALTVAGDSAGGNLAAAVALRARQEGKNFVSSAVLLYPSVNISGEHTEFYKGVKPDKYRKSAAHAKVINAVTAMMGQMLGGDTGNMLNDIYLQGKLSPSHIYASPILADLSAFPKTLLIFGEHDFLVFEDFAFAQTLTAAKTNLTTVIYEGMGHGFADQIGVLPQAEDCINEIAKFIE